MWSCIRQYGQVYVEDRQVDAQWNEQQHDESNNEVLPQLSTTHRNTQKYCKVPKIL